MSNKQDENYQPGAKYSIVKSNFALESAKLNYSAFLKHISSLKVDRTNVDKDLSKEGREMLKKLTDKKNEESKEPLKWHEDIMAVFWELYNPINEQVERLKNERKVIAEQVKAEQEIQLKEQQRIADAKNAIISFTNRIVGMIANAKTDSDIVSIEKLIGLEKTKKYLYQEFIDDLIAQCELLKPQIKTQKDNIRELQKTENEEKNALESGDIAAAAELRDKKEYLEQVIEETGLKIHETAFNSSSSIEIVAPDIENLAPKGRSNWKWKVDDIKLLQKKMPHLVKLVPDDEAIDLWLKTKKTDGSLVGKEQESINGITFYNDRRY